MTKNLLNATKKRPYSPEGTFNLKCILDKCVLPCVNSTLLSRQKLFHSQKLSGPFKLRMSFATFRKTYRVDLPRIIHKIGTSNRGQSIFAVFFADSHIQYVKIKR